MRVIFYGDILTTIAEAIAIRGFKKIQDRRPRRGGGMLNSRDLKEDVEDFVETDIF